MGTLLPQRVCETGIGFRTVRALTVPSPTVRFLGPLGDAFETSGLRGSKGRAVGWGYGVPGESGRDIGLVTTTGSSGRVPDWICPSPLPGRVTPGGMGLQTETGVRTGSRDPEGTRTPVGTRGRIRSGVSAGRGSW